MSRARILWAAVAAAVVWVFWREDWPWYDVLMDELRDADK